MESTLQQIGIKYGTDKAVWHQYCDFYQSNLPGRDFCGRILELGVWEGSSIKMWREYYPLAHIVGVDIIIRPRDIEGVTLVEMDASNPVQLSKLGNFDIIVDDASHMCSHQQIAFNQLFNNQLNSGGFYVMEDAQTSFWEMYRDAPETTYNLMKRYHNHIEFNRDGLNESISIIIPKK